MQSFQEITASKHMIDAASKRYDEDAREMIANDRTHSLQQPMWRSRHQQDAELPTNDDIQPQYHRPPYQVFLGHVEGILGFQSPFGGNVQQRISICVQELDCQGVAIFSIFPVTFL
mmetsp:Transcript_25631/g.47128  ORF Transcript_25631/g.47128 Transcript_25631/m.47128 type:complete len:116 (-) Transcript_25631:770-1117(-)